MGKYIRKRLLQSVPIVFGITLLTFLIMKLAPGGPLAHMINPRTTAEALLRAQEAMGLNRPILVQYWSWLTQLLQGNFGYSTYYTGQPVIALILQRLPATLLLTCSAFVISFVVGIPLGVYSATHKYSPGDYGLTLFSFIGISVPSFFFGMGLIYIFAVQLGWFPTSGYGSPTFSGNAFQLFLHRLRYLVMPMLAMSLANLATVTRFTRSSMVETLNQDYIRTARAKGLAEKAVIYKHALKNSLIPVITIFGLSIPNLFGGAYITEKVFGWPGLGLLGVSAINNRDYSILMGLTLFTAILVLVGNLVADILYSFVDPRIRY
ncbi:MAG: ABC transporter permease [Clostridiales bacterium]|jgi:peptide/nickel transport system permease protein|nr:ABC transporter permease [Clostridiales bacterium]